MAGLSSAGVELRMGSTPVAIANVSSIKGPEPDAEFIDVTALDSTGNYREFLPSFLTAGTVQFDLFFDSTEATHKDATGGLFDVYKNSTLESFEVAQVNGDKVAFSAYVKKPPGINANTGDAQTASCELQITGALTWTYV